MNRNTWKVLLVLQTIVLSVAVFVDFGFDHPGQFGLSFGHFLVTCGMYGLLFLAGALIATVSRAYKKILYQLLILVTVCIAGLAYRLTIEGSPFTDRPFDDVEFEENDAREPQIGSQ